VHHNEELESALADSITFWPNLSRVVFDPPSDKYGNATFIRVRDALLRKSVSLKWLSLGSSACSGEASQLWASCTGLQRLKLLSPGRALLDATPAWLKSNYTTLEGFHAHVGL
jgi:hypothetical protein